MMWSIARRVFGPAALLRGVPWAVVFVNVNGVGTIV